MDANTDTCAVIDLDGLTRLGSALADDTRRRLLVALARGPGYPAELAVELGESRQKVSNHLACLRDCGLVVVEPEGRRMRYELVDARLGRALRDLAELMLSLDAGRRSAERSR
ncbi:ArsR/SmtB family transcription factor [Egicoccus halophilus]|nr:metalloregulator ArsR/SmtB family transcription factor [Egicoccus halophilus]